MTGHSFTSPMTMPNDRSFIYVPNERLVLMGGLVLLLAIAAVIDARWRRFPNWLAVTCAIVAVMAIWMERGTEVAIARVAMAFCACSTLLLFELLWRRYRGGPGLGLGDIKAFFALAVYRPVAGVVSFGMSLVALSVACIMTKRSSLPLLPFLVPVFVIMCTVGVDLA